MEVRFHRIVGVLVARIPNLVLFQSTNVSSAKMDCQFCAVQEVQSMSDGQIHFFPILYNGKDIYETMAERCGLSKRGGQKK